MIVVKIKHISLVITGIFFYIFTSYANLQKRLGQYEINVAYGDGNILTIDHSQGIEEYRLAIIYSPYWYYKSLSLGADFSIANIVSTHSNVQHDTIHVIALAPILRWFFYKTNKFNPYIEAGIGPAYLSKSVFSNRHLGSQFTFQDFFGIGSIILSKFPITFGVRILHYSNASLSDENRGITVPIVFYIGLRF